MTDYIEGGERRTYTAAERAAWEAEQDPADLPIIRPQVIASQHRMRALMAKRESFIASRRKAKPPAK
jgi:hypothetical protein